MKIYLNHLAEICTLSKKVGVSIPTGAYLLHISSSDQETTFMFPPFPVESYFETISSLLLVYILGNITGISSPSTNVFALANVVLLLSPISLVYTFPKNRSYSAF